MKKRREPTKTSLVEALLRDRDDFLTARMVEAATGCNRNQVSAALIHLRKRRVIDVVIEVDGTGWWYALPPESDNRSRVVAERTPEVQPRKRKTGYHRRRKEDK